MHIYLNKSAWKPGVNSWHGYVSMCLTKFPPNAEEMVTFQVKHWKVQDVGFDRMGLKSHYNFYQRNGV